MTKRDENFIEDFRRLLYGAVDGIAGGIGAHIAEVDRLRNGIKRISENATGETKAALLELIETKRGE